MRRRWRPLCRSRTRDSRGRPRFPIRKEDGRRDAGGQHQSEETIEIPACDPKRGKSRVNSAEASSSRDFLIQPGPRAQPVSHGPRPKPLPLGVSFWFSPSLRPLRASPSISPLGSSPRREPSLPDSPPVPEGPGGTFRPCGLPVPVRVSPAGSIANIRDPEWAGQIESLLTFRERKMNFAG